MHPFVYMHLTGNHTVGIVSGFEDYDVLKASCKNIFAEINELVDTFRVLFIWRLQGKGTKL